MELHCPYSQYAADTVCGVRPGYRDRDTYVARSSVHGYGLFAARNLPKGFVTGSYGGQRLKLAAAKLEEELGNVYLFDVEDAAGNAVQVIDGRDLATASKLRYINAPGADALPNSAWLQHDGNLFLQLTEDVVMGAEILALYGGGTDVLTRKKRPAQPATTRWLHTAMEQPTRAAVVRLERERRALEDKVHELEFELAGHQGRTGGVDAGGAAAAGCLRCKADAAARAAEATRLAAAESRVAELERQLGEEAARAGRTQEQLREAARASQAASKQADSRFVVLRHHLRDVKEACANFQQQLETLCTSVGATVANVEQLVAELKRALPEVWRQLKTLPAAAQHAAPQAAAAAALPGAGNSGGGAGAQGGAGGGKMLLSEAGAHTTMDNDAAASQQCRKRGWADVPSTSAQPATNDRLHSEPAGTADMPCIPPNRLNLEHTSFGAGRVRPLSGDSPPRRSSASARQRRLGGVPPIQMPLYSSSPPV